MKYTLPTTLYLHLSGPHEGADFTVFTTDMRNEDGRSRMSDYPFVCVINASYAPGINDETVNAQMANIRLGALYQRAGEFQAKLDSTKEEISKLLCIGHEKPLVGELMPFDRVMRGATPPPAPKVDFDDDIPF